MYLTLLKRLRETLAGHIREKYGVELSVVLERPPKLEMGEAASPVCFELAKRLKKAPRQTAQEIANSLPKIEGIGRVEVAGAGYLNAFFDRAWFWESARKEAGGPAATLRGSERKKVIVEHTSINPNKAAHIGHLRNAVLGDTMVRLLRHTGQDVAVQNYIDNTGVQVADVVIAFQQMEKKSLAEVKTLAAGKNFDYLCWDLYAKATQFFEEDKVRAGKLRGETLKAIEAGEDETAEMATVIADAVVGFHLRTMARLDIYYELLARESEILHLHFWDAAFEKLKAGGAIQLATSGKNAGCWIMPWGKEVKEVKEVKEKRDSCVLTGAVREHRAHFYLKEKFGLAFWVAWVAVGAQDAAPLQVRRSNGLGSGGPDDAVFEEGDELRGIAGWREAGLAGADDGEGFAGGEMRQGFF